MSEPTPPLSFTLNFNRKDFEEIYYQNNQLHFTKSERIRLPFWSFFAVSIILILLVLLPLETPTVTVVMLFVVWCILLINYSFLASYILIKRWQIKKWLDREGQYANYSIALNETGLTLHQDENINFLQWSAVKFYEVRDDYLYIEGSSHFFFPRKSFNKNDWQPFRQNMIERLKATK